MKKLLALAMALVLSLSLVACGGGDSSAAGGEIVIDSSYTSPETQIQSAENLISAGCNAILIVNSSDTMLPTLGKLCEENQVYWGL